MAACSSSSLGILRCRRGGLSYLRAGQDHQKPASEMRFGCSRGGGGEGPSFLRLHRPPPLFQMVPNYNHIVRRACLVANLNNCRSVENSVSEEKAIGNIAKMATKVSFPFDDQKSLDEWMSYSVSEIVRNIGEAPLLMLVYSKEENIVEYSSLAATPTTSPPPRIEREIDVVVSTESWPHIRRKWEEGSPIPDGVILVEELDHHSNNTLTSATGEEDDHHQVIGEANHSCSSSNKTTKTWGVLVQGRGTESTPACYILKTCRVWSSLGFCTHFCLVRAKCFGEIAELQLNNSWLAAAALSN